jgi:enoyl-CoA hydratase/carnithine racemase
MVAIARSIGRKRAVELALSGDEIDAPTAAEWGLVNRVVPDGDLDVAVEEMLARVTRGSRASKGRGKTTLLRQIDLPIEQAYELAIEVMAAEAATGDGAEGIRAFAEKRRPEWRHEPG